MGEHIFVAGGLVNWPDAELGELQEAARETREALDSGYYCDTSAADAEKYVFDLWARVLKINPSAQLD